MVRALEVPRDWQARRPTSTPCQWVKFYVFIYLGRAQACHGWNMKTRRQLEGVYPFLLSCESGDWTQVIVFDSNHPEPSRQLNSWVLNLQRIEELLKGNAAFLCRDQVTNWLDFCQLNCHITPRYLGLGPRRPQVEAHSTADAQLSPEFFLALILEALGPQAVEPSVDRRKGKLRKPSEHATEWSG